MHQAKTPSFEVTVARTQKCRARRVHYAQQQESRGLQVNSALGRLISLSQNVNSNRCFKTEKLSRFEIKFFRRYRILSWL